VEVFIAPTEQRCTLESWGKKYDLLFCLFQNFHKKTISVEKYFHVYKQAVLG
jgi:hypothetical protein